MTAPHIRCPACGASTPMPAYRCACGARLDIDRTKRTRPVLTQQMVLVAVLGSVSVVLVLAWLLQR